MKNIASKLLAAAMAVTVACAALPLTVVQNVPQNTVEAKQLAATPFALSPQESEYVNNGYGLSNPFIVGVDEEKYNNEVLYPAPEGVPVISAAEFGVKGDDGLDDTIALTKALDYAKETKGAKILQLPSGNLTIIEGFNPYDYGYGIVIDGIDDLYIRGDNTVINYYGEIGFRGMHIKDCKNITLANVAFDWGVPPFVMGTVTAFSMEERWSEVTVNDGYDASVMDEIVHYLEFDKYAHRPRNNGNFLYNHNEVQMIRKVERDGQKLKIYFNSGVKLTKPPIGTIVACSRTMHFSETFIVNGNENVRFETVDVYSGPGMAMKAYSNTNLYFNRFRMVCKPGTDRLLTNTSDTLHLMNNRGEISVTNCTFEGATDDCINIGGQYYKVFSINNQTFKISAAGGKHETYRPRVGDKMEVRDTQQNIKGVFTVSNVELFDNFYNIQFKEDASVISNGDLFGNLSTSPKARISNSVFRNKRNRGILICTRDVVIENCVFSNILHGAIQLVNETDAFNEAIAPWDVTIRNNKFLDNTAYFDSDISIFSYNPGYQTSAAGAIRNVVISNNFFANSRNAAVMARGVDGLKIESNLMYRPALQPMSDANKIGIELTNSEDILLKKNDIQGSIATDFKGIVARGTTDISKIEFVENNGISLQDLLPDLDVIEIASTQNSITVDGNTDEWTEIGTKVSMISCTRTLDLGHGNIDLSKIDANDFSVDMKMTHTAEGIYFMANVKDESVRFNKAMPWIGDVLEIFITTDAESFDAFESIKLNNTDTAQIYVKPEADGGAEFYDGRTSAAVIENFAKNQFCCVTTESGYSLEGFLSLEAFTGLKQHIESGREVALTMNFSDADETGQTDVFSTTLFNAWENKCLPFKMSKFKFV